MEAKLGHLYSGVLTDVVSTISGFSLEVISEEWDTGLEDMTGIMCLNGKMSGTLFISAKEEHIRRLCSYMIGAAEDEVSDEDTEDSLKELTNIVAGGAKLRLSNTEYAFNLSPPFVIKGQDMSIGEKNKPRLIARVLTNGDITVKIKIVY